MLDVVLEATKNLRREGIRTFLTLIGIVIGIAAIVSLLSIGAGLNQSITQELEGLGSDTLFMTPSGSINPSGGTTSTKITETDIRFIESLSTVKSVLKEYQAAVTVEFANERKSVSFVGVNDAALNEYVDLGYIEILDGRWLEKGESSSIVINEYMAKELFSKEIGLRKQLYLNGKEYKVVGVMKMTIQIPGMTGGTGMMFVTYDGFSRLFPNATPVEILIKTTSKDVVDSTSQKIKDYFEDKYGKKSVTVLTYDELLDTVNSLLSIITIFLAGIAGISLIVGGIGIMNAMVTSVIERTKEIGVMKALGASNNKVLAMFILEAGFIGAVGGIIGIILGYFLAGLIAIVATQSGFAIGAVITFEITLGALLFSMAIGMISGFYPAYRAAKMDPVNALRYE